MKKIKKICVITGTRAEYGLLSLLMKRIKSEKRFKLQIICTGSHLSKMHGYTRKDILKDGFKINYDIDLMLKKKDNEHNICISLSKAFVGFSKAYTKINPDIIVVLGDRYELLAATYTATIHRIPICHIHGGESTMGVIDEATRHSISKMAHLHFVANKTYKKRVIQLGEKPSNVHNVGGMGVDIIDNFKLLKKNELEKCLKIKLNKRNFLIVFHPSTLEINTAKKQFKNILYSIKTFKNTNFFFSQSNADIGANVISNLAKNFVNDNKKNSIFFKSLGQKKFLSLMKYSDVIIGNSSSAILEAPTLKIPAVNIGNRQKNRLLSKNVISCDVSQKAISKAIKKSLSKKFIKSLTKVSSKYGRSGASKKCLHILKKFNLQKVLFKKFHDLKV